jgi:adenine deaminase
MDSLPDRISQQTRITQELVACAMGRHPADLLIRNGRWVCVQSGEIIPDSDIAVVNGRVAYVGPDAGHTIGPQTVVVDADDRYLVPGLLDAHMHIESGMLTVTEFVRAVIPHGTTGMFADPHEIANVFGLRGVRLMVDEALQQPIHVFIQVPSCVPSAPGLETSGAVIGPVEVAEALSWPGVIGLGEMMNYPGVYQGDENVHSEMAVTRLAGKIIGGHYTAPDLGLPFHAYAAGGPQDDHEGTRLEDAVARVRQGMRVMLRYGSAWHDVAEQIRAVTERRLDSRYFILCSDDSHSATLVGDGNMDRVIRHAISQGLSPVTAIQMATINTADYFGVSRDMGLIAPGRHADILLVRDLTTFQPEMVFARGRLVAENGQLTVDLPVIQHPQWAFQSVNLKRVLAAADFRLHSAANGTVTANVIGVIENQAPTRHLRLEVETQNGEVFADLKRDLAKIALVERHHGTGTVQLGLVQGFGFREPCAVATTVAHDSHQMIVVGTEDESMAAAVNHLAAIGGGQVVVCRGEVIGQVELPIGGLISNRPAEQVARQAETVLEGFRACGCSLNNPNMQLSLLGLVVIPDLRISDKGLIDVNHFCILPVLEGEISA